MKIERLVVGQLKTNCYLAYCSETQEAVIIDPGDDADFIIRKIQDLQLKPKFIIATHGHFDHVLAITELKLIFKIAFLMNKKDLFLIKRADKTAQYFTGAVDVLAIPPDKNLIEGEKIVFGRQKLKVIETPGHTPGSISLYAFGKPGILFSGDTLFAQGLGRTDFAYASSTEIEKSLKKLLALPSKTRVFPGHGPETTIGKEKKFKFEV